jgi:hypothetical protein
MRSARFGRRLRDAIRRRAGAAPMARSAAVVATLALAASGTVAQNAAPPAGAPAGQHDSQHDSQHHPIAAHRE